MLEEYYVLVTCIPIVKTMFMKFIKAVFILLPESAMMPPVRPFNAFFSFLA